MGSARWRLRVLGLCSGDIPQEPFVGGRPGFPKEELGRPQGAQKWQVGPRPGAGWQKMCGVEGQVPGVGVSCPLQCRGTVEPMGGEQCVAEVGGCARHWWALAPPCWPWAARTGGLDRQVSASACCLEWGVGPAP